MIPPKWITALALGVAIPAAATAQTASPECIFEHYTALDGLPHNSISDIYKDSKGFVWLCTWYGLSRFDGYTFRNYRTPLSHNRFLHIHEDSAGYLWVVTYDDHLFRFNRHTETFDPIALPGDGAHDYKVGPVVSSGEGTTWISIEGRGLFHTLPPEMNSPPRVVPVVAGPHIGKRITALEECSGGRMAVVSERGLAMVIPDGEGGFRTTSLSARTADRTIMQVTGGKVYYATGGDVAIFDDHGKSMGGVSLTRGESITALEFSAADDILYIGTRRHGVARYRVSDGTLLSDPDPPGRIRYLKADSHGTLWVGTEQDGIARWDPRSESYKRFTQPMNAMSYYIDTIPRVMEAGERVWIKMNRVGFGYYDRASDEVLPFYNLPGGRFTNGVPYFIIEGDNVLWMSTSDRGLEKITIIDPKADIFDPTGNEAERSADEIRSLTVDRSGRLWMGNKNGDLFCFAPDGSLVRRWPDSRSGPIGMAYSIVEDREGNVWVGTKGDGVVCLTPRGGDWSLRRWRHDPADARSLSHDDIYAIAQDGRGRIWFGSYGGAINMLESPRADHFTNTATGFDNYPSPLGQRVRSLHLLPDGTMAVGTVEGLLLFDPSEEPSTMRFRLAQKRPGDGSSLGNNDVIHMMTDSKGRVWVSTFGGGLNLLEGYDDGGEPRFRVYSENEGLASNIVLASTEGPDGDIWVSTERGLSRLDTREGTFANYSRWDGIPAATFSEATAATTPDGKVLMGSTTNLVVIDPATLASTVEPAALTFTGLQVDNREVTAGPGGPLRTSISDAAEITLPHNYSVFRIEFAALNHRIGPRVSYMYRLEGFEREWTRVKEARGAVYTNVPHGDYRFVVRSVTDSGADTGDVIDVGVRVMTPPWKSWWAWLLYLTVGAAAAVFVYRTIDTRRRLRGEVRVERRLTELKLQFFTNISHELRTPLTLILGSVEEVGRREALSPRGESNVAMAGKNARRMLNLINQLLDFRKIAGGKMDIRVRRTDIVALVRGVVEDFREMASERRIELMTGTSSESLDGWVDPPRMESVVYNLLSNAFKYTPDGGRITVSVSHRPEQGHYTISVGDSGSGIPAGKQEVIFERFVQVDVPLEGQARGTGIGLALCREIAELHHGTISVESPPGEGATFTVKLPTGNARFNMDQIEFESASAAGRQLAPKATGAIERQRVARKAPPGAPKLLLVEDNHELRVFIYNNLIDSYNVSEAADGVQALEMIAASPPDIIVTDLMMPRMDGIELTNTIRGNFETSHIPIVMLTARTETDSRTEAMRYGADGYITKPFSMELLQARIENLLRQRRNLLDRYSSRGAQQGRSFELVPDEVVVTDRDERFLREIMEWIEAHLDDTELTIESMAVHLGIGRTTMYNKIKGLTGKSPVEIIKEYRVTKARGLLRTGQFTVSEAAYRVGFSDPGYFSKCFKEQYKISPAEFLKTNRKPL
jgi:signal transduction histidine kinase/DNA-binding response OmpR family regulator/ligand-binding sensor domain-containing protein